MHPEESPHYVLQAPHLHVQYLDELCKVNMVRCTTRGGRTEKKLQKKRGTHIIKKIKNYHPLYGNAQTLFPLLLLLLLCHFATVWLLYHDFAFAFLVLCLCLCCVNKNKNVSLISFNSAHLRSKFLHQKCFPAGASLRKKWRAAAPSQTHQQHLSLRYFK